MNILYKTTLLITMAVVTWKVVKIERSLKPEILTRVVNKENEKCRIISFPINQVRITKLYTKGVLLNGTRIQILLDVKGFVEVSGLSKDDFEKKVAPNQEFKNLSINLKTVANVTSKLNRHWSLSKIA